VSSSFSAVWLLSRGCQVSKIVNTKRTKGCLVHLKLILTCLASSLSSEVSSTGCVVTWFFVDFFDCFGIGAAFGSSSTFCVTLCRVDLLGGSEDAVSSSLICFRLTIIDTIDLSVPIAILGRGSHTIPCSDSQSGRLELDDVTISRVAKAD